MKKTLGVVIAMLLIQSFAFAHNEDDYASQVAGIQSWQEDFDNTSKKILERLYTIPCNAVERDSILKEYKEAHQLQIDRIAAYYEQHGLTRSQKLVDINDVIAVTEYIESLTNKRIQECSLHGVGR